MFDINAIRNDFPMFKNNPDLVYFDSSATSFKPYSVINRVLNYYSFLNANIHRGDYDISFKVSKMYEDTRITVKKFINAENESEIVFTSGDTESLNLISYGFLNNYLNEGDVILTTLEEHASSVLPLFRLLKEKGVVVKYIQLNDDGTFNMDNYEKAFDKTNVKFVQLAYVSNVLGYINPIKDIVTVAHAHGALVSIDAAQAVSHIKIDVQDLNIDFLSFSAHKMCGPSGVGVLYAKKELLDAMSPLNLGGGANARFEKDGSIILKNAPYKFEAGTPNIEGVLGLDEAVKYLMNVGMDNIYTYTKELNRYMLDKLSKLDNIVIYNKNATTGIVTFNFKDIFAQDAATYLNSKNICVRSGNHCAKILKNVINTDDTIRASLFFYNTKEEIDRFIEVVQETTLEKCIGAVI